MDKWKNRCQLIVQGQGTISKKVICQENAASTIIHLCLIDVAFTAQRKSKVYDSGVVGQMKRIRTVLEVMLTRLKSV